jgi:FkbM family methyltransferase
MNEPIVLKTKYAYHALLWLLAPDVVLDIGSMDGSDSKRFRSILPHSDVVAFEANPNNYRAMCSDAEIGRRRIKVLNNVVSDTEGECSFFVQLPLPGEKGFNKGSSSLTRRAQEGATEEEVRVKAVRGDRFLLREFPSASSVALWIDVEGHAYSVMESMDSVKDRVTLVHVETETREIWPGQKIESDVLRLAKSMDLLLVARGAHAVQRDLIFVSQKWHEAYRSAIGVILQLCRWSGPTVSRLLSWTGGPPKRLHGLDA